MNENIQEDGKYRYSKFTRGFVGGLTTLLPGLTVMTYLALSRNNIPIESEVQKGYAVPSKLEIKLEDLDGNGEKEVLMKYDGRSYLLKLDENGKPIIQEYELSPAKIVPK